MTKKEASRSRKDRAKRLTAEAEGEILRRKVQRMEAIILVQYGEAALAHLRQSLEVLAKSPPASSEPSRWPGDVMREALSDSSLPPVTSLRKPEPAPSSYPPDELTGSHAILPRHATGLPRPPATLSVMLDRDRPES